MTDTIVVAFGGNAITPSGERGTLEQQRDNVRRMSAELGRLLVDGYRVVVTHGNGPQVGEIMLRSEIASHTVPPLSLHVAGAMSQGQIGFMLQQEIGNILREYGMDRAVCSVITQVEVDPNDPAFSTPTKPIGRFYQREEADALREQHGWNMVEDAGRGYRRVVASPRPRLVIEWPAIQSLIASGALVIAAGGGGIPVMRDRDGRLGGVDAVIDKDLAAQKLASLVGAHTLVLLTEVEAVAVNFGTPEQRVLQLVGSDEMQRHMADGQFPAGSMGPKVQAALDFLRDGGARVIITSPSLLVSAVNGFSVGTQIVQALPVAATAQPNRSERSS